MNVVFPIKWKISFQKFDNLQPNDCLSKNVGMIMNDSWILKLRKSKNNFLQLKFENIDCNVKFRADFHIFIYNSNPKKLIAHKKRRKPLNTPFYKTYNLRIQFQDLWKNVEKPKTIIIGGKLHVVQLNLSKSQPEKSVDNENQVPISENSSSLALAELSNDFGFMFNNLVLSDVTINCNNQVFWAHKFILIARCPALGQTIQNTGLENVKIDIHTLAPDVTKAMLYYIYTGKIEPLTVISACDLLLAANMYNLQSLRNICVKYLKDSLTVDNVVRIFTYAYMIDDILRFHVLKFMSCHFSAIENSSDWQNFRKEEPHLATDVLTGIVKFLEQR